jgi:pSer/pThr/pTyr-binding forkhead associated (FHA) protein
MALADAASMDESTAVGRARRQSPFGAPHVFVLVVIGGQDTTAVHRIVRPETLIGRAEGAHFILDDGQVSKAHCKIRVEGPVCTLVDLGSRNGTSVNGRRLMKDVAQRLRHLDEIEIGKYRLFLLTGRFRDKPKNKAV